jgi:cobalt-zinc-cadmium efflux system protein
MGHHHNHAHTHHSHDHHHHHAPANYGNRFILGISLNVLFIIVEIYFSYKANSNALFADASHNVMDVFSMIASWFAFWLVDKKAPYNYTYGFKRVNILISLLNALLLIGICLEITIEAIHAFITPNVVLGTEVIWVAALGILVNGFTAFLFASGDEKQDLNIKATYLHFLADAVVSFGVVVSGIIIYFTQWYIVDVFVTILIVLFILYHCRDMFGKSVKMVLDAVPDSVSFEEVKQFLLSQKGVTDAHDIHLWHLTTTEIALTAHLVVAAESQDEHFLTHLTHEIQHQFEINHITIQVETQHCNQNCNDVNH